MNTNDAAQPLKRLQTAPAAAGDRARAAALVAVGAALMVWGSPPLALIAGMVFALAIGQPFALRVQVVSKWLLQISVVLLGFSMDLAVVLRSGLNGSLFAATTIGTTLLLGWWIGRKLGLPGKTSTLISVGTAICGGSAIAAVSSVIGASGAEIAVSIGTIFLLNAVALYVFPLAGHLLHLDQAQFGLWAGVAIHDISSVVGAGISYGTVALQTATAVKLSRALWIVPVTMGFAAAARRGKASAGPAPKIAIPWFIGIFLLASLMRSYVPAIASHTPMLEAVARHGMVLVLFLIGSLLSREALRAVGWRTAAAGVALWMFISVASLSVIMLMHPNPG